MKQFISVCKNVIASNNKKKWKNPEPDIRVSSAKYGKVTNRSNKLGILDEYGNVVAEIIATTDGEPIIGCGAKVGLITKYETIDLDAKKE